MWAQHRDPHRLAQAIAGRPGPRLAPDPPPESVWREKDDLLLSVPGIGDQISLTLLAYLPQPGSWWTPAPR